MRSRENPRRNANRVNDQVRVDGPTRWLTSIIQYITPDNHCLAVEVVSLASADSSRFPRIAILRCHHCRIPPSNPVRLKKWIHQTPRPRLPLQTLRVARCALSRHYPHHRPPSPLIKRPRIINRRPTGSVRMRIPLRIRRAWILSPRH